MHVRVAVHLAGGPELPAVRSDAQPVRRGVLQTVVVRLDARHGGDHQKQDLDENEAAISSPVDAFDLLTLNETLDRFEAAHPRRAKLVKLRYFAGLTLPEVAAMLDISQSTAEADWTYAKAWLHERLAGTTRIQDAKKEEKK